MRHWFSRSGHGKHPAGWLLAVLLNVGGSAFVPIGVVGITKGGWALGVGVAMLVVAVVMLVRGLALNAGISQRAQEQIRQPLHPSPPKHPKGPESQDWLRREPTQAEGYLWEALGLIGLAALIWILLVPAQVPVNFRSAYDGLDPVHSDCSHSARTLPGTTETLRGTTGADIGYVHLRTSRYCGTVWAQVFLRDDALRHLAGRSLSILVVRPADGTEAPYALPLTSRDVPRGNGLMPGYGNQLGGGSCVYAQVSLLPGNGKPAGPTTDTPCRLGT